MISCFKSFIYIFSQLFNFFAYLNHIKQLLVSRQSAENSDCPLGGLKLFLVIELLTKYNFWAETIKFEVLKFEKCVELIRPISLLQFNLDRL